VDEVQPLSGSSSSINNVAANAVQSSVLNTEDSPSSTPNVSNQRTEDSFTSENRDEYQHQESTDKSDEQSTTKPSRGAGASIFGGAKPVDTAARELEIEKKLKELKTGDIEPIGDTEEKETSSK
jgi:hypothetical protein